MYETITSFKEGCEANTELNYVLGGESDTQRMCNLLYIIKEVSK